MIDGIQFKVCGLTTLADAEAADRLGADFLGFNLYAGSPRRVGLPQFRAIAERLLKQNKVAVMVEPTPAELDGALAAGFDRFQIHARADLPFGRVEAWSRAVGDERLWLAPKLPPDLDVPEAWLPLAWTFLMDTFQPEGFGGSGKTGDWAKFVRHRVAHPDKTWILAGGLNPANIREALARTEALFVDVNSGIESAPGVKDHAKLKAFATALHR